MGFCGDTVQLVDDVVSFPVVVPRNKENLCFQTSVEKQLFRGRRGVDEAHFKNVILQSEFCIKMDERSNVENVSSNNNSCDNGCENCSEPIDFDGYYLSQDDPPFDPEGDVMSAYVDDLRLKVANLYIDHVWRHVDACGKVDVDYAEYLHETFLSIVNDAFSDQFESMLKTMELRYAYSNPHTEELCDQAVWT